jgi:hypothetical protein
LVFVLLSAHLVLAQDIALLNLRIVEGEGAVYAPGSRATRGITVEVTDELARPVPGVAITFVLPESGPTGTFTDGKRTEVAITKEDGRATVWGMRWGKTPGTVELRLHAAKGKVRAGTISTQYLSTQVQSTTSSTSSGHKKKYLILGLAVAGGVGAGMAFGRSSGQSAVAAAPAAVTTIGTPSITLGRP